MLITKNFIAKVTLRILHVSKIILSLATNTHLAVSMYFNLLLLQFFNFYYYYVYSL